MPNSPPPAGPAPEGCAAGIGRKMAQSGTGCWDRPRPVDAAATLLGVETSTSPRVGVERGGGVDATGIGFALRMRSSVWAFLGAAAPLASDRAVIIAVR